MIPIANNQHIICIMVLSSVSFVLLCRRSVTAAAWTTSRHRLCRSLYGDYKLQNRAFATGIGTTVTDSDGTIHDRAGQDVPLLDPLVVCGPSGVGKGTIIERFMSHKGTSSVNNKEVSFGFTVSHTTREPRPGEVDGVHYHFVSHEAMAALLSPNDDSKSSSSSFFLEHAMVHGNTYGTSWDALRAVHEESNSDGSSHKALLDIDVQGVQRLKQQADAFASNGSEGAAQSSSSFLLQPKYIFIAPPDLDTLRTRLAVRGTEDAASLARRTAAAEAEVTYGTTQGNFDAIIVNQDLDVAVQDFVDTVQRLYDEE